MAKTYGNREIRRTFTRTATTGLVGGQVEYVVPVNVYFGDTQAEADQKAEAEVNQKGQAYADEKGSLTVSAWLNERVCDVFTKDDCELDVGSEEEVCVGAGRFISYVSQEDANEQARRYLATIGQEEANANGYCCHIYRSRPMRGEFFKDDCPAGQGCKDPVIYTLEEGAYTSRYSQTEADNLARVQFLKDGQAKANADGVCVPIYTNDSVSDWFTKNCPFGYRAEPLYYSVSAGRVSSFESKEAANEMAMSILLEEGQQYAEYEGSCEKWIENIDQEGGCYW